MKQQCLALCAFLSVLLHPLAQGQDQAARFEELLDAVRLPPAFRARAFLYRDDPEPEQRIDIESADEWCAGTQYLPQPGLDFIPFEYFHYGPAESWKYDFSRRVAARSDAFSRYQHCPIEGLCSPRDVLRALRSKEALVDRIESQPGGVFDVKVSPPGPKTTWIVTIDPGRGELLRKRVMAPDGQVASDVKYENWLDLPSGGRVPTQLYHSMRGPVAGDPTFEYTVILTEIASVESGSPPPRLRLASDFSIVDEIEGVSKRADGTVLSDIDRGGGPAGLRTSALPGPGGLNPRLVVLCGVGFILLAGVIVGVKRWKGV